MSDTITAQAALRAEPEDRSVAVAAANHARSVPPLVPKTHSGGSDGIAPSRAVIQTGPRDGPFPAGYRRGVVPMSASLQISPRADAPVSGLSASV
ncbi:hypothetical protein SKAU_G00229590 [Synaphobranchus kaupii]|uniref:Uncharacterized protein n=1 Tax=Synaphobranchus kaupii TaxID=118154 RepID=A0A9Q1F5E0_SYNKA|nr:hypothetical protein SKAU_G00229590 [Synaphobranchus kaupii]